MRAALVHSLGVALLLVACRAKAPSSATPDAVAAPATPAKPHAPHGPPEEDEPWPVVARESESKEEAAARARIWPLARLIDRALFKDGGGCVSYIHEAGRDRKGQELLVVSEGGECLVPRPPAPPTAFGSGRLDRRPPREPGQTEPAPEEEAPASAETDEKEEEEQCTEEKYYLVARKGTKVRPVALLSTYCRWGENHMFGINSAQSVEVDKESRTFTESRLGRNNYEATVRVGLDPLRILSASSHDGRDEDTDEDPAGENLEWDPDAFKGTATWSAIDCKAKAQLDARARGGRDAGTADGASGEPTFTAESVLIPSVGLPDEFLTQGWRTTRLGGCSALGDYPLHGPAGQPGDAKLQAVVAGGILFVEISDDRFVGPGRSWVTDDHLELWVGEAKLQGERVCGKEGAEWWSAQWGIRVADGAVFPAHGAPAPLAGVERVVAGRTARFKIPLPGRGDRLTVVYSDSDDGRRQERLIGTSQLRFGDPATLGQSHSATSCIVKGGALQPQPQLVEPSLDKAATDGLW